MPKITAPKPVARDAAQQVFRQFAWNLAGSLHTAKSGPKPTAKTRPARRMPAQARVVK